MQDSRGKILWVDDEIHHLKPHILFLEEKGYNLIQATNGDDAIALCQEYQFDLILLDQSMPGMDGLKTLQSIKHIRESMPIIMITKTEDEWLMDEAITSQVEQFLIKPVNPSQIFMACKQVLEKNSLREERVTSDYLKDFQDINACLQDDLSCQGWWELYNRLVRWQLKFDEYRETGLGNILTEQIQTCNREFSRFIEQNFISWLSTDDRPVLSTDFFPHFIMPLLKRNSKVCLIVLDCLRHDQFMSILPILENFFNVNLSFQVSLIPSATPYSRNAIFSGLFPDEMVKKYPEQKKIMSEHASSLNQFEKTFLVDQIKRHRIKDKSLHYHKIWAVEEGQRFQKTIQDLLNVDILAIVVNFVDILAHRSSQMDILKEMVPDEAGYRTAVLSWTENSWFNKVLKVLSDSEFTVIITSDHGSIRVQRDVMVAADREASSGVRYKYGRNLNARKRNALIIKDPAQYRLPVLGPQFNYLIAKDDVYFVYPNEAHKYKTQFRNSFQHGGISMEELLVPVAIMKGL